MATARPRAPASSRSAAWTAAPVRGAGGLAGARRCRRGAGTWSASRPRMSPVAGPLSDGAGPAILAPRGGPVDPAARPRSSNAVAARHGRGGTIPAALQALGPVDRSRCGGRRRRRTRPGRRSLLGLGGWVRHPRHLRRSRSARIPDARADVLVAWLDRVPAGLARLGRPARPGPPAAARRTGACWWSTTTAATR